jgi:death-on-curing protein
LNSALNLPRQNFAGQELYPTIVDKAAILFYVLNKNHPFRNGNKRISAASLLVFLYINEMWLDAGKTEIVEKTLNIARSEASKKDEVVAEIKKWIKDHLVSISAVKQ